MGFSSRDLVERLGTKLPLVMEFADPITGAPFVVNRDNMLSLLAIDVDNLVLESQTCPMLFGEMARVHRAAEFALEQAEAEFRSFKGRKSMEARGQLNNGHDAKGNLKPPTKEQVEEFYRADPDYLPQYSRLNRLRVIPGLIVDLKKGFEMKLRALGDLHKVDFGHGYVEAGSNRLAEMEERAELDSISRPMMMESGATLANIVSSGAPHPGTPTKPPTATSKKRAKRPGETKS